MTGLGAGIKALRARSLPPMKRETIGVHTLVSTTLTSFGAHVLAEYLDAETERASGQANPKLDGPRVPTQREVEMPLWELLKVFGRTMVSSARLPFEEAFWQRIYAPELSLGMHTAEEVADYEQVPPGFVMQGPGQP